MARSNKECILSILKELKDKSFKEFKMYLNDENIVNKKIPIADLEEADRFDVTYLLIKYFTQENALEITYKVLEVMGEKDLATRLK